MERERIIEALKICDANYDGVVCKKCPIKDEDYNGSWCDKDGDCYQHLMREAAELLSEQPTIQPVATDTNVGNNSEIPNSSDAISRQWLLDCINDGWIKFDTDKDANRFIHLVRDIAPTIQPEPTYEQVEEYCKKRCLHVVTADFFESTKPQRLGHWVDGRCNECGGQAPFWVMASTYYESDFCPHCGARMTTSTK